MITLIMITLIIGIVCGILWVCLKAKDDWDNINRPPRVTLDKLG